MSDSFRAVVARRADGRRSVAAFWNKRAKYVQGQLAR
jgi:hypothetical protein